MRVALAILLSLHGIAHFVGFAASWRLLRAPDVRYATTILGGALDLGDSGIRVYGLIWLMMGLAFVAAGMTLVFDPAHARRWILIVAACSTLLCIGSLPDSRIGLGINLAILAGVAALYMNEMSRA